MSKLKLMTSGVAILSLLTSSALATAPNGTVKVLRSIAVHTTDPGPTAQVSANVGPFSSDALVFVAVSGQTIPTSSPAGAVTRIKRDGVTIAADDSYDDVPSSTIPDQMNAARQIFLRRGIIATIVAEVDPTGSNGSSNTNTFVDLRIDAIQVCTKC